MRQYVLPNGAQVLLLPWPSPSVTVTVGIRSGSRDDPKVFVTPRRPVHLQGQNHFSEHAVFRATKQHPTWEELATYADGISANYNAFTDKSTILFCMETARGYARDVIRFLSEIIRFPLLTKANVGAERERIRQEYRVWYDEPYERVQLDLERLMFPGSGLDHPTLGTEDTIKSITAERLRNFHRRVFVGQRLVIVLAGGFDPDLILPAVRTWFGPLRAGTKASRHSLDFRRLRGTMRLRREETQQLHCLIGWPTPGINDPRRIVLGLIRNALTRRTSSRLKLKLDSVGHGYSLSDFYWCYSDIGEYHIYVPLSADHLTETLRIIGQEIADLRRNLMPPDELWLSKRNMSIDARAKFGESWAASVFAAQQTINAGVFRPLRVYDREVRAIKRPQVREVASDVLDQRRATVVIRGPVNGLRRGRIRQLLKF